MLATVDSYHCHHHQGPLLSLLTARYHCPIKAPEPQHIVAGPNPAYRHRGPLLGLQHPAPSGDHWTPASDLNAFWTAFWSHQPFFTPPPFRPAFCKPHLSLTKFPSPGTVAFVAQASLCTESYSYPQPRLNQRYKCDYGP